MLVTERKRFLLVFMRILLCLCSAMSLTWGAADFSVLPDTNLPMTSMLLFSIVFLHRFLQKKDIRLHKGSVVFFFFLSVIWLVIETFKPNNAFLFSNFSFRALFFSLVYILGSFHFMCTIAKLFYCILHADLSFSEKIGFLFSDFSSLKTFILLCICFLPHVFLAFPGILCVDSEHQLAQFFGKITFTAHHPPIHTLFLGALLNIGTFLSGGHQVFGYFFFVLVQTFVLILVLTYMFSTMKKLHTPNLFILISFVFVTVCPYFTSYVGIITKDCLYSYMFLLYIIELVWLLILKNDYWRSVSHNILYFVSVCGVYLFRNNGKHVLFLSIIVYLFFFLKSKDIVKRKTAIVMLLLPVIFSMLFSTVIMHVYSIEKGGLQEALSFPFQQTARYVYKHSEDVTAKEQEIINCVLPYDKLASNYDPLISDPVKNYYKSPSKQELFAYFRVWLMQGFKHPYTYVEATIEQNQSLIYPYLINGPIYKSRLEDVSPILSVMSDFLEKLYRLFYTIPVIGLFSNIAFLNFLLILLCSFSSRKKNHTFFVVATPVLLSDLVIVFAPCIWNHPRYAFPIVYSMPILFAYYFYNKRAHQQTKSTH